MTYDQACAIADRLRAEWNATGSGPLESYKLRQDPSLPEITRVRLDRRDKQASYLRSLEFCLVNIARNSDDPVIHGGACREQYVDTITTYCTAMIETLHTLIATHQASLQRPLGEAEKEQDQKDLEELHRREEKRRKREAAKQRKLQREKAQLDDSEH